MRLYNKLFIAFDTSAARTNPEGIKTYCEPIPDHNGYMDTWIFDGLLPGIVNEIHFQNAPQAIICLMEISKSIAGKW